MNTLLTIIILLASGGILITFDLGWITHLAVFCAAIIAIAKSGRINPSTRFIISSILIFLAYFFAALIRGDTPFSADQINFLGKLIICITIGLYFNRYTWPELAYNLTKTFEIVAFLSLGTFIILNVLPQSAVEIGKTSVDGSVRSLFGIGYLLGNDYAKYGYVRNQGIFWEPGVLGFMVVLFAMLKLYVVRSQKRLWLYTTTMLTTMSAGAIPLYFLAVSHYYYMEKIRARLNNKSRAYSDILLSLLVILLFIVLIISLTQPNLMADFFKMLFGRDPLEDSSIGTRSADLMYGFLAAMQRPFFGHGEDLSVFYNLTLSETGNSKEWYNGGITNSIIHIFYKYGIIFLALYLTLLWRLAVLIKPSGRLIIFALLLLMLMHEPLHFSLLMIFLLTYALAHPRIQ